MPAGQEFITHEFDEAIAVQEAIVSAGEKLSTAHPLKDAKQLIRSSLKADRQHLTALKSFGRRYGASGKREEVAGALEAIMKETASKATEEESGAYEAHAVLLNLKRKQQDSAAAVVKIARKLKNTELRDAATEMQRDTKRSADELAKSLGEFAVKIAVSTA